MNCRTASSLLSAYLDRELTGDQMYAIREHLRRCEACRQEFEGLRTMKTMVNSMLSVEPPPGLEQRLCQRIFAPQTRRSAARPLIRIAVFATAAAGLTLLALQMAAQPQPTASETAPRQEFNANMERMYVTGADPFGSYTPVAPAAFSGYGR